MIRQHNQDVLAGLPCLEEKCPVLLCPNVTQRIRELTTHIEVLEERVRELEGICSAC